MDTQKEIEELLKRVEEAIKDSQIKKGLYASGESAKSLRYVAGANEGVLFGVGYFYQQEYGRKSGSMPPIKSIYDWLKYQKYGLTFKTDNERKSLAFAIAKNIAKKGTWIYQGKKSGIEITQIITQQVAIFNEKLTKEAKNKYIATIKESILKK